MQSTTTNYTVTFYLVKQAKWDWLEHFSYWAQFIGKAPFKHWLCLFTSHWRLAVISMPLRKIKTTFISHCNEYWSPRQWMVSFGFVNTVARGPIGVQKSLLADSSADSAKQGCCWTCRGACLASLSKIAGVVTETKTHCLSSRCWFGLSDASGFTATLSLGLQTMTCGFKSELLLLGASFHQLLKKI